uniref:Sushi domain-containing protein n=1 Tax=Xenopus tropicalis TaxID=8364 RepID=A0A803J231_XENTR
MTKNVICGSNNSNSVVFWAATIYTFFLSVHCSCDSPPRLSYAGLKTEHMDTNIFPIGSVVRYECRPGYMKIPMKKYTAECLANATWSKPDEFCKKKVCKYPGDIYYGYFNETDFSVGSRVTYFCDKGYIMISKKNYRYCQVDGSWSNSAPVCEAVTCPPPKHVSGVIYNPQREEYTYLESVKYRCIADKLEIIGERYTFCTEDGTWSNHPPKCIDVICPNPVVPYSNKLSGFINPYKLNYAVTFECKEGFSMKGSDTITCGIDSQWKPQIPSCLRVNCSIPMVPNSKKLSASMGPYKLNDIVRFECVEGFSIKGFDTITCGVDSQWKPQIPSCLPTAGEACPEPIVPHGIIRKQENVLNGTSGSEGYSVGQLVKIECDLHYGLNGHNILTCGSDLLWYPNIPVCQPKHFCPEPKVFHGQIINGTPVYLRNGIEKGYKVGDVIKLKCDPKHHLKGKNSIFCGSDMKWHPRIPICEHRLGCSYPEIKNGLIVLRNGDTYNPELNFSFFLGDTVQVKCKPGFAMYGNERSKCGGYFEWSPDLPICVQGNKQ